LIPINQWLASRFLAQHRHRESPSSSPVTISTGQPSCVSGICRQVRAAQAVSRPKARCRYDVRGVRCDTVRCHGRHAIRCFPSPAPLMMGCSPTPSPTPRVGSSWLHNCLLAQPAAQLRASITIRAMLPRSMQRAASPGSIGRPLPLSCLLLRLVRRF